MKCFFVLITIAVAGKTLSGRDTYCTDHDNLDIQALVSDERQFKDIIGCFISNAPFTIVVAAFKKAISEAMAQACAKCTPAQKHIVKVFLDALKKNKPEDYQKFKDKYDPERKYYTSFKTATDAF